MAKKFNFKKIIEKSVDKATDHFQDESPKSPRHVMIATPSYRGDVHVYYVNSLVQTVIAGLNNGIIFHPWFISNDALVQRCRNDIFKLAYEQQEYESLLCIDGDMIWDPQWAVDLVNREEDIVGATARKKTDEEEMYVTGLKDFTVYENDLMKAMSLGMGFVKVSRNVINTMWEQATPYINPGGRDSRMLFDIGIVDGELWGEDSIFWKKCREHGFQPWVDPKMTCDHVGQKVFSGDFKDYLSRTVNYLTAT